MHKKIDDDLYLVNECNCVRRWRCLSVDILMKMIIGDYMCCDYFGIELWHRVNEDFEWYFILLMWIELILYIIIQGSEYYVCDVIRLWLNCLRVLLIYFILLHVLENSPLRCLCLLAWPCGCETVVL
jgi:hypothetical protein